MKIGIIGGNSKISVELALLLREAGHEVIPVVRNKKATAFLADNGFDCRVADSTDPDETERAVDGLDSIVVAAYAGIGARDITDYREAWNINRAIVRNSIYKSPNSATVIYFSSLAAFGNELYDSTIRGRFDPYSISKRLLERETRKATERVSKDIYSLRLGHVFGPSQPKVDRFRSATAEADELVVEADPNADSNVVHTVTLRDAVEACSRGDINPGTYTVVNEPQWTWAELFEYYASSPVTLRFVGQPNDTSGLQPTAGLQRLTDLVVTHRMKLLPLQLVLPDAVNKRVVYKFRKRKARNNIEEGLGDTGEEHFFTHEFEYNSVPGPFIEELKPTRDLLGQEQVVKETFETND